MSTPKIEDDHLLKQEFIYITPSLLPDNMIELDLSLLEYDYIQHALFVLLNSRILCRTNVNKIRNSKSKNKKKPIYILRDI